MICRLCNHENPDTNHFCGNCGDALIGRHKFEAQKAEIPEFDPEAEMKPVFAWEEPTSGPIAEKKPPSQMISGPSFLGLTDDTEENSYLLEEETPRKGRVGWIVFSVVAVVVLSVIGWVEWRAYQTGSIQIPFLKSSSGEQPKTSEEGQTNTSETPAGSTTKTTADAKPQSEEPAASTSEPAISSSDATATPATTPQPPATTPAPATPTSTSTAAKPEPEISATPAAASRPEPPPTPKREIAVTPPTPKPKPVVKAEPEAAPADPRKNQMLLLGESYLYGKGMPRNCQRAVTSFESAAREDNAPAMSHLGAMYASGNCVSMNRPAAYRWFVRASAADPHNQWIQRSMNMLWRDMSAEERASVSNR